MIEPFFETKSEVSHPQTTVTSIEKTSQTKTVNVQSNQSHISTQTNKTPSISKLGVSISAFSQEKNKKVDNGENKNQAKETLTESFTPLELLNKWKSYAESLVEEHHLKNTMINCLPDLLNRDTFEVVVNNPVQEQRLIDNTLDILNYLREQLRNTNIQMKVRVTIDNEKKLGFTSLEKFNLMAEQNQTLKRLKDEFGLELL